MPGSCTGPAAVTSPAALGLGWPERPARSCPQPCGVRGPLPFTAGSLPVLLCSRADQRRGCQQLVSSVLRRALLAICAPSMLGAGSSLVEEEGGNVCVWTCSLAFLGVWINSRVGLLVPCEFSCQKLLPRRPQQLYELRPLHPCWLSCWFPPPWADGEGPYCTVSLHQAGARPALSVCPFVLPSSVC